MIALSILCGLLVGCNSFTAQSRVAPGISTVSAQGTPSSRSSAPSPSSASADRTRIGKLPATLPSTLNVPVNLRKPVPTNTWWSAGLLEPWPSPLFAWPLMGKLSDDGLMVSAPGTEVIPTAVMHRLRDPLTVTVPNRELAQGMVKSWGDFDVTVSALDPSGKTVFDATFMEGSPFAFVHGFAGALQLNLPPGSKLTRVSCKDPCDAALLIQAKEVTYLITGSKTASFGMNNATLTASFSTAKPLLSIATIAPKSSYEKYLPYALTLIQGTAVSAKVFPDRIETTYRFPQTTLYGVFPHQSPFVAGKPKEVIGVYPTLRGEVKLSAGTDFTTILPRPVLLPGLPIASDFARSSSVRAVLTAELQDVRPHHGDVYAAAKDLLRSAQLAEIADGIGDADLRAQAVGILRTKLSDWCTASDGEEGEYFAYDDRLGGLIPVPPAFGSEHYNDHHFHAGYFLHAGAILARLDPSFASEYGECMRLLVRDIASPNRNDPMFPYLRHFDPYAGHSWASGLTAFDDGTNQESTSEAIQAWYAIALWGKTTGDQSLENLGVWLLAQESQSARTYWLNMSDPPVLPREFSHPLISILWGGKADFATFFDASPAAIHGIQFFPVTTALLPVLDANVLSRLVLPPAAQSDPSIWKSNLSLVSLLSGKNAVPLPPDAPMDFVYSRSYLQHWTQSLQVLGAFDPDWRSPCSGAVFKSGSVTRAVVYRFPQDGTSCTLEQIRRKKKVTISGLSVGWNVKTFSE